MSLWGGISTVDEGWGCIAADPPWGEAGGGGRGAQNHYQLIDKRADILHTMLGARFSDGAAAWRPAPTSHLWLWVTNTFLADGLWLMGQLGFRYVTNAVWCKTRQGLGQYLRGKHELCLFGVRGNTALPERAPPSVFGGEPLPHERDDAGKIVHSRKPARAYQDMAEVSPVPRLEMFARRPRDGWTVWGNESDHQQQGQMRLL